MPAPDWDGAINGLRDALNKDASNAEGHNILGRLLGHRRHLEARKLLEAQLAQRHGRLGLALRAGCGRGSEGDEKKARDRRSASHRH